MVDCLKSVWFVWSLHWCWFIYRREPKASLTPNKLLYCDETHACQLTRVFPDVVRYLQAFCLLVSSGQQEARDMIT